MLKLAISLLSFSVITSCTTGKLHVPPEQAKKLDIQGHRGARTLRPENTLPAFQYALEVGVDTIELDVGVTRDNILVVHHDSMINRKICQYKNGNPVAENLWLRSLSLTQIKEFDCGSKLNPRFPKQKLIPGTEIPTLNEVFQWVKSSKHPRAKSVLFNIETKTSKTPSQHHKLHLSFHNFAQLLVNEIERHGLENRVTVQSFEHRTLRATKKINPNIQLAALYGRKPPNWIQAAKYAKADIVSPHLKLINKQDVLEMQAAGFKVIPWTANEKSDWQKLIDMKVDGIITDDPKQLLTLLGR